MHNEDEGTTKAAQSPRAIFWGRLLGLATRLIIPVCILAAAAGFLKHQIDTRPQAQRMKPPRQAHLVTVETVKVEDCRTRVEGMGPVMPACRTTLNPEVSGIITRVDSAVVPGGLVEAGRELYAIDARDYETLVRQRESELARAQLNLKLEAGNQTVARAEYGLLEEVLGEEDEELVLRKPHLANAQAAVDAARAALEKARLDVARCTIRAPFNGIIMEKHVDAGARVSPTTPLLQIIGADEYWIEAKVGADELQWLDIPQGNDRIGSLVHVSNPKLWGPDARRQGRILRLLAEVEPLGKLAQVLISVQDPLSVRDPEQPVLLAGSLVRVEIEGRTMPEVAAVQRSHLRDGDKVWVMNAEDALEIRPVTILFRGKDTVYVSEGLKEGERIVTTDLATPVEGMPLRVINDSAGVNAAEAAGRGVSRP